MELTEYDTVAFVGDSITEWGRDLSDPTTLGLGYVSKLVNALETAHHSKRHYYNFGKRGYQVEDVIRILPQIRMVHPTAIVLLIGVNDVWHYMNHKSERTIIEEKRRFKAVYRQLITQLLDITPRILVLEPFLMMYPLQRLNWRELLDYNIQSIRSIVYQHHLEYVALDGMLMEAMYRFDGEMLTKDGVHPKATAQYLMVEDIKRHLEFKNGR